MPGWLVEDAKEVKTCVAKTSAQKVEMKKKEYIMASVVSNQCIIEANGRYTVE